MPDADDDDGMGPFSYAVLVDGEVTRRTHTDPAARDYAQQLEKRGYKNVEVVSREGRPRSYDARPDAPDRDYSALLEEWFVLIAAATDGIVVDDALANDAGLACHCTTITKKDGATEDLCFKRGVIGTLSQAQTGALCKTRLPMKGAEGFQRHIKEFQAASEECSGKGLEDRIRCMGTVLGKEK